MAAITDRVVQVLKMKIRRLLFWTKKSAPVVLAFILLGCEASHKNICPIDGQPPGVVRPTEGKFLRVLSLQYCRKEGAFMVGGLFNRSMSDMAIFHQLSPTLRAK
jgi:hypothetical protein